MKCKGCNINKPILFYDDRCGECLIAEYDKQAEQVESLQRWQGDALDKKNAEIKQLTEQITTIKAEFADRNNVYFEAMRKNKDLIDEIKRLKAMQIMLEQEIERLKYTLREGQNDE